MTDKMLGPSSMQIKYLSYVYDWFCIWRTNFPGPIESVISKFTCIYWKHWATESRNSILSTRTIENWGKRRAISFSPVLMCWSPYCYWHNCVSLLICLLLHNNDIIRAVAWYIGHTKRTLGECMCKHCRYVTQHNSSQVDHQYQTTCLTIWGKRSRFAQIFKDPTRTWATMDL